MSLKSILLGACVGAGVALLYAPATGRTTRAKIRDKATGMGHDVTEFVEGKKRHLTNKMEGYKAKARGATEKLHDMMGSEADHREMSMAGDPTI
jgi:gas vesicle protein